MTVIMHLPTAQKQTNFTTVLHFALFALATLPCSAAHEHSHGCVHNSVALRVPFISAQQYKGDRRQQSWESIRITFDFNGIDSSLPAAQKTYITKLITDAGDWLQASLMVKRVSGNLKFDDAAGTNMQCGEANLNGNNYTKYISTGVAADLVIFVLAQGSTTCAAGNFMAYASHCRQDQFDRPTFGYIQMCPQHFAVSNIQAERDQDFHTAVHEITHILGYSSSLFAFFRDINGAPYTARCGNPSTHPTSWLPSGVFAYTSGPQGTENKTNTQYAEAWCCASNTIGWPPWKCQGLHSGFKFQVADTVIKVQTVGGDLDRVGNTSRMLVTPTVVSVARQHFGCPTLAGVEVEDDGGQGSVGSHWEERQMMSEYMVAASNAEGLRIVKSNLTLALLQDSGWYKADYAAADILRWGYRQGCQFLNSCGSQSSIGWCSIQSNLQCSFDRSGIGNCSKSDYYMDGCPVTRNYWRTCNWVWLEPQWLFGGNCSGKDCTGGTFSNASACFESSLFSSAHVRSANSKPVSCYDYACIPTNTWTSGIILSCLINKMIFICITQALVTPL
jgi:hypothetical protein